MDNSSKDKLLNIPNECKDSVLNSNASNGCPAEDSALSLHVLYPGHSEHHVIYKKWAQHESSEARVKRRELALERWKCSTESSTPYGSTTLL